MNFRRGVNWVHKEINWQQSALALLTMMPLGIIAAYTGDSEWLILTLPSSVLLLTEIRSNVAPLGAIIQGILFLILSTILYFSLLNNVIFVMLCAISAAGVIVLMQVGVKLESFAFFIFVPSVYLSFDSSEGIEKTFHAYAQNLIVSGHIYKLVISLIPGLLMICILHAVRFHYKKTSILAFYKYWTQLFTKDLGEKRQLRAELIATFTSVLIGAALVEYFHIEEAPWLIWSCVAVIGTGSFENAKIKTKHRFLGAVLGVLLSIIIYMINYFYFHFIVTDYKLFISIFCVLFGLTFFAFKTYPFAYGSRSAIISFLALMATQSIGTGELRVLNGTIGAALGLICLFVCTILNPPAPRIRV
jgi:Fusaric acid resistance protein-like